MDAWLGLRSDLRVGYSGTSSWTLQESQVERCEHQDDSNIHYQPFPESVSEEHEIYTDYDGYHRHHVKHDSYLSAHFSPWCRRDTRARIQQIASVGVHHCFALPFLGASSALPGDAIGGEISGG